MFFKKIKANFKLKNKNFSSQLKSNLKLDLICKKNLEEIKQLGTYKQEKYIQSPQGIEILVSGKKLLNFCANNYLGLANDKQLIETAQKTFLQKGFGMSSVRFICGTQDIHKELEAKIAKFHKKEDSILYSSGFDANAGFFEAVLNEDDLIISDSLNHASIIDGIRLSKAKKLKYEHLDLKDLEQKLLKALEEKNKEDKEFRFKFIVTDGVFSMDGDFAPLDKIVQIAEKYDCNIFVDDAHASGFIGKTGKGTAELFQVEDKITVINSTLGKALGGGSGGYTTSSKHVVDILRQKSRPYLFSNSLVPAIVASSLKVFEILDKDNSKVEKLKQNTIKFRTKMKQLGFNLLGSEFSPIVPVLLKEEKLALEFGEEMIENGIYVVGFCYPVVPKGKARIRVQLSAAHEDEHIEKAISIFEKIGKKKNII